MKRFKQLLTVMLVLITIPVMAEMPSSRVVQAVGEGTNRDTALNDAKRLAVEQAVGVYVLSETLTKNFQVVKDSILTKSSGFISDYRVAKEEKKDGLFRMTITATVGVEPLVDQLGKLGLLRNWTIAVVLASNGPSQQSLESARTKLNGLIVEKGFRVADENVLVQLSQPAMMQQIQMGNYLAAAPILRDNGVDVLITGKAFTAPTEAGPMETYGGVKTVFTEGRIDARAVRADTGEILAAKSFNGISGGSTQAIAEAKAIEQASSKAGEYFVKEIAKLPASVARPVLLAVKGVSFASVKQLETALNAVEGVAKVNRQFFRSGQAQFELMFNGSSDQLAERLMSLKGVKLEITGVTSGKIEGTVK